MTTTKNIDIKGIQVEIDLNVNHSKEKATVYISTQDWNIFEPINYIPCAEADEYDTHENQIIDGLAEVVIEERAKNVAKKVAELTEFAMKHNLSQSDTKISIDYAHHSSEVIVQVWGNFDSTKDRVGEILKTFVCPTTGENEYDVEEWEDEYDLFGVLEEIKAFMLK